LLCGSLLIVRDDDRPACFEGKENERDKRVKRHRSSALALSAAFGFALLAAGTAPASAHVGAGSAGGLAAGFFHPLTGPDHIVAMVAVGLWGAFLGAPAIWALPILFPMVMAFGGAWGMLGLPLPFVETGVAASGLVLGLMVLLGVEAPLWIAALLVGAFAIFHGYAHGVELPEAAEPLAYSLGFVVATGLLHLCGIGFGSLTKWPIGRVAVRTGGGLIAITGLAYLIGVL
jgi:urease accessory protein